MLARRLILLFAPLALLVSACGAPEYEYVKNSEQQTYFKVPNDWRQIDQEALHEFAVGVDPDSATAQLREQLMWTVAYDAAEEPSITHIAAPMPFAEPAVWAKVERLLPEVSSAISLDVLRNLLLPVTEDMRTAAAQADALYPGFELLRDDVIVPEKGLHGVRVAYNYQFLGRSTTFDLTALVNDDASLLYMLLIRCAARCYTERADELESIATSFTVRS
ncbi:hypothetical protein RB614_06990 [Phytohabitans sp. ZYX-F-186]|uniref:Lipoprotein n=1 Tax=Phytohabitans maris TaxID=3071409 RepID=A0ABU0ZD02_9ACTN|nr:hypothetical protein [Phytohabitans sp. ZYX-F-186]MDQ7904266.1 hypothetical protein [Phytohabitans sp. ZYX-F-186]